MPSLRNGLPTRLGSVLSGITREVPPPAPTFDTPFDGGRTKSLLLADALGSGAQPNPGLPAVQPVMGGSLWDAVHGGGDLAGHGQTDNPVGVSLDPSVTDMMNRPTRKEGPPQWLGIIADAFAGAAGKEGPYAAMMQQRHQEQAVADREEAQWTRRRSAELEDRTADANKPQYFAGNEDRVVFDPTTNSTRTVYDAPTDAQTYAGTLGYQPGSPDYTNAVQDYTLRSNGPTAVGGRIGLEGVRYGYRDALQADRLTASRENTNTRVRAAELNNLRAIKARQRGQDMTDSRTRGSASYQGRGGRGAPAAARAVDPSTGHAIVVRNGQWVDEKTGKPVG